MGSSPALFLIIHARENLTAHCRPLAECPGASDGPPAVGGEAAEGEAHLFLIVLLVQQLQPSALQLLVPDALLCEGVAVVMTREQSEVAVLLRVKIKAWKIFKKKNTTD